MVYVKYNTTIPVPTVYGYCPTRDNAVGQPFMILSFVSIQHILYRSHLASR